MKWIKRISGVAGSLILLVLISLTTPAQAQELIPFITPPAGGGAYVLGAGIVSVTNKYLQDVKLVHEASSGTMDTVRRMQARAAQKKDCFGIFSACDAYRALKGQGEYSDRPFSDLRGVVYINGTDLYFAVPAKSPIKSYADAKGKRIGMGGPGSTVANTTQLLLDLHGVTKKDFKPYYYTYKETVEGIQDGSLDGGFLAGGYPISSYSELSVRNPSRIVPVDEKVLQKIAALAEDRYYYATVVKAKSYRGLDQDVPIIGFTTQVFTTAGGSNDLVYRFIKNLFDHKAEYYGIHISAKDMTVEDATKGILSMLHPGAEKYFREIGAIK